MNLIKKLFQPFYLTTILLVLVLTMQLYSTFVINRKPTIGNIESFVLKSIDGDLSIAQSFSNKDSIKEYVYYFDPYCSDCINLHEKIEDDLF